MLANGVMVWLCAYWNSSLEISGMKVAEFSITILQVCSLMVLACVTVN